MGTSVSTWASNFNSNRCREGRDMSGCRERSCHSARLGQMHLCLPKTRRLGRVPLRVGPQFFRPLRPWLRPQRNKQYGNPHLELSHERSAETSGPSRKHLRSGRLTMTHDLMTGNAFSCARKILHDSLLRLPLAGSQPINW